MQTPPDAQEMVNFIEKHLIVFGSLLGTVVAFGFVAGRYVFDKQLNILKQENELIGERLAKAQADLEQKNKQFKDGDPIDTARIRAEKVASDRGAGFRFFISVAILFSMILSGGAFYLVYQLSVRESQYRSQQDVRQSSVDADLKALNVTIKEKVLANGPNKPKAIEKNHPAESHQ